MNHQKYESDQKLLMNLHIGKMSRRKQARPNRHNEDEENDCGVFNGKLLLLLQTPLAPILLHLLQYLIGE